MASPASVARHPIHPMLIPFPVGLFVFSLACDVAARLGAPPAFGDMAYWAMVGGVVGALVAAVPGFIDFLSIRDPKAQRTGLIHMGLNLTIVVLYLVNLYLRTGMPPVVPPAPFILSIVAVGLLVVSGWFGWALVYEHGVGISGETEIAIAARRRKDHAA